jgi:predicted O-linked N-acetylglucosamine transferase (SPINDLY family)
MAIQNILTHSKKRKALELAQSSHFAEARTLCVEICQLDVRDAEAWFMLGTINGKLNNAEEAIECFRKAVTLQPDYALAHFNLGMALRGHGRSEEAVNVFRKVTSLVPQRPEAYVALGQVLMSLNRFDEAEDCLQALLRLTPQDAEAWVNLGRIFHAKGHFDEAVSCYRRALQIEPRYAAVYDNLACALCSQCRHEEAVANHRMALDIIPDEPVARSNLLLTLNYLPEPDPEEVLAEHKRWAKVHAPVINAVPTHANTRHPERRLRVGYVSSDLRTHAVAYFFEPVLANYDRTAFEVICYSGTQRGRDATTQRLQNMASQWRETLGLTDEQLVNMIRTDGIDILVDLAGHTSGNRLKAFVHRPAPVQVTYLGYPNTTGLTTMDYLLTDELVDPLGEDIYYTEKLIRLPGAFFCYAPPADAPVVTPLPSRTKGFVTFGSLNMLAKLNDQVIDLWCEVLRANVNSRLLVYRNTLKGAVKDRFVEKFAARGIDSDRLHLRSDLSPGQRYLDIYGEIDIALDTFPWSGHTTSCEALWMGVPVITLYGKNHAGRMCASLLAGMDLSHLTARTPDDYVGIATALSGDLDALEKMRAQLRARMAASPLCDGRAFARKVEEAYREMWRSWCAGTQPEAQRVWTDVIPPYGFQ